MARTMNVPVFKPFTLLFLVVMTAPAQTAVQQEKANRAKEALSAGNFAEAAHLYGELTRELPNIPGIKMNLGMAYYFGGRYKEAAEQLSLAVRGDPKLTPAWLYLGGSQLEIGRPQEAAKALETYLKAKPGESEALQLLGDAQAASGQHQKAVGTYEAILKENPGSPRAWYGLGRSYEGLAGDAFGNLEKIAPESGYWFALVADSRVAQQQYASAFYFYRKALEKKPDLRGIHVAISRIYRATEHPDWAEKEEQYEMQLGLPDCSKEILVCNFLQGELGNVLEQARKLSSPEGFYWQAQVYSQLALDAFSRLTSLPSSAEVHGLRAEIHRNQGRHWESVKEWQKALELAPDDPRLKRELAVSLYLQRNYDEAQHLIDELLKKDPQSGELNYLAGDILLYQERTEEAIPLLQKAVKYSPDLIGARSALGRACLQLGEAARAIPHLKAALPSDEDGSLHFQLARAYQKTGQEELAKQTMARYQEITQKLRSENKKLMEEVKITPP